MTKKKAKPHMSELDGPTEFGIPEFEVVRTEREKFMNALGFTLIKASYYPDGAMWTNISLGITVNLHEEPENIVRRYNSRLVAETNNTAKENLRSALMAAMGLESINEKDTEGFSTGREILAIKD